MEEPDDPLCCTICRFDLSDALLARALIPHQLLDVATCSRCSEQVDSGEKDSCNWCGSGDGVTLLCCDTPDCQHEFCTECVGRYQGTNKLKVLLEQDEAEFLCFVCDDTPISQLQTQLEEHLERHIDAEEAASMEVEKDQQQERIQKLLDTLAKCEAMFDEANQQWEPDQLEAKRGEIIQELKELKTADSEEAFKLEVDEEMSLYTDHWRFKSEILSEKSVELQEELDNRHNIASHDFLRDLELAGGRRKQQISEAWGDIEYPLEIRSGKGSTDASRKARLDAAKRAAEKEVVQKCQEERREGGGATGYKTDKRILQLDTPAEAEAYAKERLKEKRQQTHQARQQQGAGAGVEINSEKGGSSSSVATRGSGSDDAGGGGDDDDDDDDLGAIEQLREDVSFTAEFKKKHDIEDWEIEKAEECENNTAKSMLSTAQVVSQL